MSSKTISRRGKIRIILYLTAIFLSLAVFCTVQTVRANRYQRESDLIKQRALIALDEYMNNISVNLEKTAYASTPTMLSKLSTELWKETSGAKNSLAALPAGEEAIDSTYKFLSQTGEFVMALERKSAAGKTITDSEREQLKDLLEYCNTVTEKVEAMCFDLQNGSFSFESTDTDLLDDGRDISTLGESFDDVEQSLSDFPSLIYDGPFSDHLENAQPKMLKGESEITRKQALEKAKEICKDGGELEYSFEEGGNIPAYVFQNENCTVAITKQGGYPLYMLNSGYAGEIQTEYDEAVKAAAQYLEKIGYSSLKESYYYTQDGVCTVNFAAYSDGIIYYPDLIKVSVNLENGEIMSFDAAGYLSNHYEREAPKTALSESEAREIINSSLEIVDSRPCLIPTDYGTEKHCYEIHCKTDNGQEILVYIDRESGEEADLLLLLYSDGGVLTK